MVEHLRKMDRDYFGSRVGRGSAFHAIMCALFGIMPWSFLRGHRISAAEFIRMIEASDG